MSRLESPIGLAAFDARVLTVADDRSSGGEAGIQTRIPDRRPSRSMSEHTVETDQAAREASGAHPYGRYLEEFEVGAVYKHWPAKTVTESDDHLFCLITMNHHPLHLNDVYASKSQQGRNVVVGPLVYSLALGMSVSDVSGKAIANLATEELKHPAPVFHGDTLFCESEVLEKRESQSKPDRGTVRVHTRVLNQDGVLVAEFKRLVLVPRKQPGTGATAENSAEGNVE
jgi:acyl dehydratase